MNETQENSSNISSVTWAAVFAGAAAVAALSLILIILGFGLGFSAISPWSNEGLSAQALGISGILWLVLTQIIASAMGGYLTGRLRVKWVNVHTDEVYFRDTAHGFLAWAVASLLVMVLVSFTASAIIGGVFQAGATVAAGVTHTATVAAASNSDNESSNSVDSPMAYLVDSLFRSTKPAPEVNDSNARAEAARIFANDLRTGQLSSENRQYLGQMLARRNGITQAEAEARVSDVYNRTSKTLKDTEISARETADKARKAAAYSALWMFVALLAGAFTASWAATFGGKQRDGLA
ncbi:MAG: hypothetical protein Q7U16_01100 [Agitococcus sp.]|nr:hypothetical protein [Agitococcus sp.]